MLTQIQHEKLSRYITRDAPFGPSNAAKVTDAVVAKLLFDRDNKLYGAFQQNPTMIVGRRGSGKTAYLHSIHSSGKFDVIVEFKTEKMFFEVISALQNTLKGAIFPESVADLWEKVFLTSLFAAVVQIDSQSNYLPITRDYLARAGVAAGSSAESVAWKALNAVSERAGDKPAGQIAALVKALDNVTFEDAKNEVMHHLEIQKLRCVILVDSLDGYPLQADNVAHAICGLLKCVGNFNRPDQLVSMRFCLPAELYHAFVALSSNPNKDFENDVKLHWHAKELLFIAVTRLKLYLELYHQEVHGRIARLRTDNKDEALNILHTVFPATVKNGLGADENTLSYLLRHTQLLPRQLLMHLNSIMAKNRVLGGSETKVTETAVTQGIMLTEGKLCSEIFSAFGEQHPSAKDVCERCIPSLPINFDHSTLHTVFNRLGKKAMGNNDVHDFKRMLIEMGVMGRVLGTRGRYIEGVFEYSAPNRLVTSNSDNLCLHPIFAGVFACKQIKEADGQTVYPYGSDPDSEDLRDFQH